MTTYTIQDWRLQLVRAESGDRKEVVYRWIRWLLDLTTRRHLQRATLDRFRPDRVLPERGFPMKARRAWAASGRPLTGTTLLVQGAGNGWDVASWARLAPRRIIAVDRYRFPSWHEVADYARTRHSVDVEFHEASLDDLSFLANDSVDLVVSDAVLEHVTDLPAVLAETHRVLRDSGRLYASYGPLWYCAGGDHFSDHAGLKNAYNHVLLSPEDYKRFFDGNRLQVEDAQDGGRYVELDLFSKLATEEYLAAFQKAGFETEGLILEVSGAALRFRRQHAIVFEALCRRHPDRSLDDFLIKGNFVRLRKAQPLEETGLP